MHRAQSDGDPARGRKRTADLLQGQVGLPGNQLQHLRAVLAQPGASIAARRALPPSAIKPITRSLKSCEYGAGISPPMASSRSSFANQQAPENPSLYVSTRSETALANTRPGMIAEKAKHLPCRIGSARIGVGPVAAAAGPRMTRTVHLP